VNLDRLPFAFMMTPMTASGLVRTLPVYLLILGRI
jgi:hypothetical protein